ncbi:MAG: envelope stress response membrane protein PspC [Candidatus Hydrogenedentota bacterium]
MRTHRQRNHGRQTRAERRAARREAHYDKGGYATYTEANPEYGVTLYRSRNGMCCGVCKGIADYYQFNVFWVRFLFVVGFTFTGVWPAIVLYVIAAMVMKVEPVLPLESEEDEEFYHSYSGSRSMALQRLKRTFDTLDRRIQRIESTVTTRDFDWEERLNR